jgi:hypothetical protein
MDEDAELRKGGGPEADDSRKNVEGLPAEELSMTAAFNIMYGWRFIPDDIPLKKRVLYGLGMGFEYLMVWVYKQILPFIDEYGVDEFEQTVLPRITKERGTSRYLLELVEAEIEEMAVEVVKKMYTDKELERLLAGCKGPSTLDKGKSAGGTNSSGEQREQSRKDIRTLFCLFQLAAKHIEEKSVEERSIRTIEIVAFFAYVLDERIFDYLISYLHSDKYMLLELLILKLRFSKEGHTPRRHLADEEIGKYFAKAEQQVEYTEEEMIGKIKGLLQEMGQEKDILSAKYVILSASQFLRHVRDDEVYELFFRMAENENKVIRLHFAMQVQYVVCPAKEGDLEVALRKILSDRDDEVRLVGRKALSALVCSLERQEWAVDQFRAWAFSVVDAPRDSVQYLECAAALPKVLVASPSPEIYALFRRFWRSEWNALAVRTLLIPSLYTIYRALENGEDLVGEMERLRVDSKALTFPSPEMAASPIERASVLSTYSDDLHSIVEDVLKGGTSLAQVLLGSLGEIASICRQEAVEAMVKRLFEKETGRNWRYKVSLIENSYKALEFCSDAFIEEYLSLLHPLRKDWAYAVRRSAEEHWKSVQEKRGRDTPQGLGCK